MLSLLKSGKLGSGWPAYLEKDLEFCLPPLLEVVAEIPDVALFEGSVVLDENCLDLIFGLLFQDLRVDALVLACLDRSRTREKVRFFGIRIKILQSDQLFRGLRT